MINEHATEPVADDREYSAHEEVRDSDAQAMRDLVQHVEAGVPAARLHSREVTPIDLRPTSQVVLGEPLLGSQRLHA